MALFLQQIQQSGLGLRPCQRLQIKRNEPKVDKCFQSITIQTVNLKKGSGQSPEAGGGLHHRSALENVPLLLFHDPLGTTLTFPRRLRKSELQVCVATQLGWTHTYVCVRKRRGLVATPITCSYRVCECVRIPKRFTAKDTEAFQLRCAGPTLLSCSQVLTNLHTLPFFLEGCW